VMMVDKLFCYRSKKEGKFTMKDDGGQTFFCHCSENNGKAS